MKTFYPADRYSPLVITLVIFLTPILLLPTLGINLYALSIFVAIFIPLLIYAIYKLTYKFIITDEGLLIEKQLFRKTRELSVNEIIRVKKCHYFEVFTGAMISSLVYETPCLENQRYKKFPRYILPDKLIDYLKTIKPDINIDPSISSSIIRNLDKTLAGRLITMVIVAFAVIYLIYMGVSLLKIWS